MNRNLVACLLYIGCIARVTSSECQFSVELNEVKNNSLVVRNDLVGCHKRENCLMVLVKIKLDCDTGQVIDHSNDLIRAGFEPQIKVLEDINGDITVHIVDVVRTKDEINCYCIQSSCSNRICDIVWYSVLPLHDDTDVLELIVSGNGFGEGVPTKRVHLHIPKALEETIGAPMIPCDSILKDNSSSMINEAATGLHYMALSSEDVLLSTTGFFSYNYIKVDVSATDNICKDVTLNAQLVLINDTLIINSKYGLIQMRQNMTGTLLMGGGCFSKIITINDELALAISSQRTKLISLYKGSTCSDEICPMNSSFSVWLNETLHIQDYEIVDISTSQYHNKVFILLHKFNLTRSAVVKTMLLEMNLASGNGSHNWQFRLLNSDVQCSANRLHISALFHFFVFGSDSCLLYSSNFGISFAQVTYDNTIVSSIHTNSKNGLFIFRTSENEVWLSQVGLFHAQKFVLSYKEEQRHVGFLFDSQNSLTEFVFNSSPKCLQKRQLNIKEIIKRTQQLSYLPSTEKQGCAYRGKCKETVFKRSSMFPKNTKCLYDSTILRLANSKYYSRIKMVHHKDQKRLLPKKWRNLQEVTSSDSWIEITDPVEHAHELLVYDAYPDKISLDRGQCAQFELMVNLQSTTDQAGWMIEDISLHFQSTSSKEINIQSEKIIDYIDNSVIFKVKFCDSGIQRQVKPPGYTHVLNHVVLQVQPSPSECIGNRYVQTTIPLQVDHGCPSSRRINIDYQRTKENVNHFCDEEYCFHFEKIFDAYLTITDDATQEIKRFLGKKNLTFIGGGPEANQIRPFTEQEIRDYNMELGSRSKLIWAISENAYSWLCGSASPCGGIAPVFPSSPYYYLNLRFNNSDTDTNCDYSFEFLIKIHGMPPDGIYPSMFVVFLCLGIMGTVVVGAYFLQGKYTPITSLLHQWRNRAGKLFHQNIIYRKNKIDIKDSIVKVNEWIEMNQKDGSSSDTQVPVMEKGTSMASLTVESQSGQDQEGLEQSENAEGQDSTSQEDVLQQDQHQDARLRRKLTV